MTDELLDKFRHALSAASVEVEHVTSRRPLRVEGPLPADLHEFFGSRGKLTY